MIYLPLPPTEVRLKSYWLVISFIGGLILAYLFSWRFAFHWLPWSLMTTVVIAIPGILKPHIALLPYKIHNICARIFARLAKECILWVCFCIMSIAIGKKIESLDSHPTLERQSHWFSHEGLEIEGEGVEKRKMIIEVKPKGFVRHFGQWTMQSGHWWTWLLLPFLALLSVYEREEGTYRVPENIYTLY